MTEVLLRENKEEKPDFTLIPYNTLARIANRFTMGAKKYARFNYLNCKDNQTYKESLIRHCMQYIDGQIDEDHLGAVLANAVILSELELQKPQKK